MEEIPLPPMERRLQRRYVKVVKQHIQSAPSTAAGPKTGGEATPLAATQAVWRFLNNPRVALTDLVEPLHEAGRQGLAASEAAVGLLVHDWSKLDYGKHASKADTLALSHEKDVGYDLSSALLVRADDGSPLAPMQLHLKTRTGLYSTEAQLPSADLAHVNQVLVTMQAAAGWGLSKPLVHVIDQEADSVDHYRQWDAAGHRFLVRGDDRLVRWRDQELLLSKVVQELEAEGAFQEAGAASYKGQRACLQVTETTVILHRPGKKIIDGKQRYVHGRPLELRLVVTQVRNLDGPVLATWLLLTNVLGAQASAVMIAHWYYWRWRIESFFKLLKSHGQQIEHWQQETALAIARRLLVASMACVTVWDLQTQSTPEAERMKKLLVRLSGRQMKRSRPYTAPALLAGLFVLFPLLTMLEEYGNDLGPLQALAQQVLPLLAPG